MDSSGKDPWRPARIRPGRRLSAWLGLSLAVLGCLAWLRPVWALYLLGAYLAPFAFLALCGALATPWVLLASRYGVWREQEASWRRAEQEWQRAMDQMQEEERNKREIEGDLADLAKWDGYVPMDLLAGGDAPKAS